MHIKDFCAEILHVYYVLVTSHMSAMNPLINMAIMDLPWPQMSQQMHLANKLTVPQGSPS